MTNGPTMRVVVVGANFPSIETERRVLASVGADVVNACSLAPDGALAACRDADGILSDYFDWNAGKLGRLERCRVICQYGVGLDQIDVAAATAAGILVTHTPDYCMEELAEHTLALLLSLARNVTRYDRLVRASVWDFNSVGAMHRVAGRTLGLVGFGRVARRVAERALALGLHVLACDPYQSEAAMREATVEPASLAGVLASSDFVSLHAPLSEETRRLIGAAELAAMKQGAILINTARGALVDQAALADALERRHLAGAGLDVLDPEPPAADERLLRFENVVVTPHAGFLSEDSLRAVQADAADEVRRVLAGERPRFAVNVPRTEREIAPTTTSAPRERGLQIARRSG